jgi:uncharacterized protein (DUF1800 family)
MNVIAKNAWGRRGAAWICLAALWLGALPLAAQAQGKPKAAKLTEDQKILHVLNRLAFGARPGDVERVRAVGLDKYIEQQLNPQSVPDAAADEKVKNLEVLRLPTDELFAKYPNPAALIARLQRNDQLPANLEGATKEGKAAAKAAPDAPAMDAPDAKNAPAPPANPAQNAETRRALVEFYARNGLKQPAEINRELIASRLLRAVYSERQLNEVMVDFWTNHFNVFIGKAATRWHLPAYDRDVIRPHALGNFKDLLAATAKSPAMLFYLDNFESVAPNQGRQGEGENARRGAILNQRRGGLLSGILGGGQARRQQPNAPRAQMPAPPNPQANPQQRMRRGINENYARELMELHTLGVDGGYTQKDVQEVARCFTGWTIVDPRGYRKAAALEIAGRDYNDDGGKFIFVNRLHDQGEKTVLGQKIPAAGGLEDGLKVIDILVKHPSTAKFIATKLARKFVMDEPTPELVNRLAAAFTKSNGDIKTTLRAVFTSPEFNSPAAHRAKIKTPFELAVSSIRALGGDTDGGPALAQWLNRMGEPLYGYQAPTGYPDKAENWVNTGGLLERLNFGLALAGNKIPGTRVDLSRYVGKDLGATPAEHEKSLNRLLGVIVGGDVSPNTKATLLKQLNAPLPEPKAQPTTVQMPADDLMAMDGPALRQQRQLARLERANAAAPSAGPEVVKLAGLILGSPEFQRQ